MAEILAWLASQPLITLFIAIALGAGVGRISIAGVRVGASAVLFIAIAMSVFASTYGVSLELPEIVGQLGLAVFAFTIGVASGPSFFNGLLRSWPWLVAVALALGLAALAARLIGPFLGLNEQTIAGTFAGALNSTPGLAAAGGGPEATVAYSVTYLIGIVNVMVVMDILLQRRARDKDAPSELFERAIRVERSDSPQVSEILAQHGDEVCFVRLSRSAEAPQVVVRPDDALPQGSIVNVVGPADRLEAIARELGHVSHYRIAEDRRSLDVMRVTVSDRGVAGRMIEELDLERRFSATISRVRRGDVDMAGTADFVLRLGDRVRVIAPKRRMKELTEFFGDSSRGLSDLNPVFLGAGIALGLVLGAVPIPLPSGGHFTLGGSAPLLLGLILGRGGRIGPLLTAMPHTAATVLTDLGLMLFIAAAGLRAGGHLLQAFESDLWSRIALLGIILSITMVAVALVLIRWLGKMGRTRFAGLLAGMQTQSSLLAFGNDQTNEDSRVALGYSLAYPLSMILKVFLAAFLAM